MLCVGMSLYVEKEKEKKSPFIVLINSVTYIYAWGESWTEQDVFRETTAGKHFAAVANINNSLLIDSRVTPDTARLPDRMMCNGRW